MRKICRREEVTLYYSVLLTPTLIGEINNAINQFSDKVGTLSESDIVRAWEDDYNYDDENDILNIIVTICPHWDCTVGEYIKNMLYDEVFDDLEDEDVEYGQNYTEDE